MTTRTNIQQNTDEVTIKVDPTGTEFGKFDEHNTPIVSYFSQRDEWMLARKTNTGVDCASLDVHGSGPAAVTEAVTAAREHLRANQTTAAVSQGS